LAPPAALIGDWFGSAAVIAPSLTAVAVDDVFAVRTGMSDGAIDDDGSVISRIPTVASTGLAPESPRQQAARRIACCARTATGSGGLKAFPAHRFRAG
jgi:hypothetical protein